MSFTKYFARGFYSIDPIKTGKKKIRSRVSVAIKLVGNLRFPTPFRRKFQKSDLSSTKRGRGEAVRASPDKNNSNGLASALALSPYGARGPNLFCASILGSR